MEKLTKEADALFALMCKTYLERVKNDASRSEAINMGTAFDVQAKFAQTLDIDDICDLCTEIECAGLIKLSHVINGVFGKAEISPAGIIQMENRFSDGVDSVIDFLAKIKGLIPFI